jgi:hypothetical protein
MGKAAEARQRRLWEPSTPSAFRQPSLLGLASQCAGGRCTLTLDIRKERSWAERALADDLKTPADRDIETELAKRRRAIAEEIFGDEIVCILRGDQSSLLTDGDRPRLRKRRSFLRGWGRGTARRD